MAEEKTFFDNLVDGVGDFADEWLGFELEQKKEEIKGSTTTQQTNGETIKANIIDWQMVGVIVGIVGVGVTVYSLAK